MPVDFISLRKALLLLCGLAAANPVYGGRVALGDARAAVLGGGPALDAGCYALGTNPAALAELDHWQFTFGHRAFPVPGAALEAVAGAASLGEYGTAAGGFGTARVGEVQHYSPGGVLREEYVYHDDLLVGGYGVRAASWLALGAAVNYERHLTAPAAGYSSLGADAGVYLRPLGVESSLEHKAGTVALAATFRNLTASRRQVYTGEYREPAEVSVGARWGRDVGRHRLALNFSLPLAEPASAALGCEFVVASAFTTRFGVVGPYPAAGLGAHAGIFSFDYGYVSREFGSSHYFTVSANPGRDLGGRSERRRLAEEWLAEGRSHFELGNYELAARRFADVLEWDPYNDAARQYWIRARYHNYLKQGNAHLERGAWEEARQAFGAALNVAPGDFLARESLARVDEREEEDRVRVAEEARVAELLAEASDHRRRGAYRRALDIYEAILTGHPGHAEARRLANETRRIIAAAAAPIPEPGSREIPADVVESYRGASAALSRGELAGAVRTLTDIVGRYPDYAAARAKLVEAYMYQGLDFYSKGSLAAAIRIWNRGLALDPGNEKLQRYIKKAEFEADQIR
jgi:tetratricopeptide (TPR) repeat protein